MGPRTREAGPPKVREGAAPQTPRPSWGQVPTRRDGHSGERGVAAAARGWWPRRGPAGQRASPRAPPDSSHKQGRGGAGRGLAAGPHFRGRRARRRVFAGTLCVPRERAGPARQAGRAWGRSGKRSRAAEVALPWAVVARGP